MKISPLKKIFLSFFLSVFAFSGCKYQIISEPTIDTNAKKNAADYADFILPPESVTASQGGYRNIDLSWSTVSNAVQYLIYAADTPFDTFTQIAETSGTETEISITEASGSTEYFAVAAVNYYGTVSDKSIVCSGTTLATPIITNIEADSEGTGITVSWWMDNCSTSSYENDITFNISVYDSKKKALSEFSKSVSGDSRSTYISGLTSTTEYYFLVEAVLNDSDQKTEKSDLTNGETAHRVVPDAPGSFTVTQGTSTENVTLSWTLPEATWYKESSGSFVLHPVYFRVYRKPADSSEDYTLIKRIGASPDSQWTKSDNAEITFNCETDSTSDTSLSVSKASKGTTLSAPYAAYTSLSTLTYLDSTAERGKQYQYYVKAYTDDTSKEMTSSSSETSVLKGWKISEANLSIISDYTKDSDGKKFTSIKFSYKSTFNNFGISYKYIVEQIRTDTADKSIENGTTTNTFSSITDLNSKSITFTKLSDAEGYYRYNLYICSPIDGSTTNYLEKVSAAGKYIVTEDASKVPVIENFTVTDGYKDKFVLSWTYNSEYTYTIHYIPVTDGEKGTEITETIASTDENLSVENGTATYNDAAVSGENRIYSLEASTGLSAIAKPGNSETDVTYSTLGTAEPVFNTYDYDTITVSWTAVQKATTDYTISAQYYDEDSETLTGDELVTAGNKEISSSEADGVTTYSCKITKPSGYNNASVSGKPIMLKITSTSDSTTDTTEASIKVRTLGPALTEAKISGEDASNIKLTWNTVEGAKGYFVYRVMYTDGDGTTLDDKADIYYVNSSNQLSVSSDGIKAALTCGSEAYTLKDSYTYSETDTANQNPYLFHQNRISWGLPFGYIVIPVLSDEDFNTTVNEIVSNNAVSIKKGTDWIYENLDIVKGAAYGYGLNLQASKATSNTDVTITWDKPYGAGTDSEKYPYLLRRTADSEDSWTKIDTVSIDQNADSLSITYDANDTSAYEYLICYNYDNKAVPQSFSDYVETKMDDSSSTEQCNKGYTFSLPSSVTASFVDGYKERFNWETYDYSKRSLGPDSYEIQIKNLNNSSDWITVATITPDVENSDYGKTAAVSEYLTDSTKVKLESSAAKNAVFSPVFDLNDGKCTSGMLQVLRDYKHYYRLLAKRSATVENDTYEVTAAANTNSAGTQAVAYRNVKNEELVRCISVVIADATFQCGIDPANVVGDYTRTCTGASGEFIVKHDNVNDKIKWGTDSTDYNHIFRAGLPGDTSSSFTSFLTINIDNKEAKYCADGSALYWLSEQSGITVSADVPSAISSTYSVSNLTFSAGGRDSDSKAGLHWNFLAKFGNTEIVNVSEDETEFLKWFPYNLGTAHKSSVTSVDTSLPIYNSPWWN